MRYEKTKYEYVFQNTKTGVFYFRGTVLGKHIDSSLKTKKISEAKTRADKVRMSPEDQRIVRHTFEEAFDLVLKIQETKAKNTYDMARRQINLHLRPWFSEHCPSLHTFERNYEEKWAEYVTHEKMKDPARQLGHDRRHLIMALLRAHSKKWIRTEFSSKLIKLNEASKTIGQHLEDEDVVRLLNYLRPHGEIYLQVLIAVTMGMRISEILHLSKDEVDLENREIDLDAKRLKIRKAREIKIPINDEVYPLLKKAYDASQGLYIFPAWFGGEHGYPDYSKPQVDNGYWWNKAREDLGIQVRFHDLRHTAITNALAAGLPSITAQKIFGATEKTIRRIYDHLKKDVKTQFQSMYKGRFTS